MPEPTFYTIEHGFVLVGRSEALPSWQRMQQSATRASRSDPTQSTRLFLQVTNKGRLHDLIFVDDLILWCWNIIYIYIHTWFDFEKQMIWGWFRDVSFPSWCSILRPRRSIYHPDFGVLSLCLNLAMQQIHFGFSTQFERLQRRRHQCCHGLHFCPFPAD